MLSFGGGLLLHVCLVRESFLSKWISAIRDPQFLSGVVPFFLGSLQIEPRTLPPTLASRSRTLFAFCAAMYGAYENQRRFWNLIVNLTKNGGIVLVLQLFHSLLV